MVAWHGPRKVMEKLCKTTYIVADFVLMKGSLRTFHINMLKLFVERQPESVTAIHTLDRVQRLPLLGLMGDWQAKLGLQEVDISNQLPVNAREQVQRLLDRRPGLYWSLQGPGLFSTLPRTLRVNQHGHSQGEYPGAPSAESGGL